MKRMLMVLGIVLTVLIVYLYMDVWFFYVQALPPAMAQELATPLPSYDPEGEPVPYFPDLTFGSVVRTKSVYSYEMMIEDLQVLTKQYQLLSAEIIGESTEKRAIYLCKLGYGDKKLFLDGAHHGSEWISSFLLMTMIEHFSFHYHTGQPFFSYDMRDLLSEYTLYIVPMVNPDGVEIVATNGKSSHDYDYLVSLNGGSRNFALWKANGRGVDLNRQYPTNWPLAKNYGPDRPAAANYAGREALSEPEARAIYNLFEKYDFEAHLTYHSVGNAVFYYYHQTGARLERDLALAQAVAKHTRYELRHSSGGIGGMARDHVVTEYRIPSLIMELGLNKQQPLPEFKSMWERNRQVPCLVMTWLRERE